MAHYDVNFSCGHTEVKELFGKESGRRSQIANWERSGLCSECYAKKIAAEKAAALEAAKAATSELTALTGSEKQIDWATKIRARIMGDKELLLTAAKPEMKETVANIVKSIENNTLASWWIDNREQSLRTLVQAAYKAANNK